MVFIRHDDDGRKIKLVRYSWQANLQVQSRYIVVHFFCHILLFLVLQKNPAKEESSLKVIFFHRFSV